ncbi:hypothetical protein FB39_003252 [Salmonella enterica subsp. diarizonae]|nr:hypothetical protein [Salmonella enterica subsp. diarizonae]
MDISLLDTTNDIEQFRSMAPTMVQNVVSENAKKEEKLRQQNTDLLQRIRMLEEMLARQQRFGRKIEILSGLQRQLFEEDTEAGIAAVQTQLNVL